MIVIFTNEFEYSSSRVMDWLNYYGETVVRIDCDSNTYRLHSATSEKIEVLNTQNEEIIDLLKAKSCWWRRSGIDFLRRNFIPSKLEINGFDFSDRYSAHSSTVKHELKEIFKYITYKMHSAIPINIGNPAVMTISRLSCIEIAKKVGLKTPDFNISQCFKDNFFGKAKIVTKAVGDGIYDYDSRGVRLYSYTEMCLPEDRINMMQGIEVFPSLFMEYIEKEFEIRTFFLDGKFYSMAIFSQSDPQTSIDFRKYNTGYRNRTVNFSLPSNIELKLQKLFNQLNLNCGSVDLILNKKGEFVFLEINPVGQYAMVGEPCNYDLDKYIAKYLIYGKHQY